MLYSFRPKQSFAVAAVAVLLYLASATVTWRGIGDWDATYYITAALGWYETGAYLGENHWQLRYPMVLPIAGSFAVFGPSEWAASLPNLAYGIMLIMVSAIWGLRFFGPAAGTVFALLLATSPALVLHPLEIEVRGPELFFSALALWLFLTGVVRHETALRLCLAGLAAGVAWLCREVAGYLLPTFVLAGLLLAPKTRRWRSAAIPTVSFSAVILAELALYWFVAGDPLYRYRIDLGHGGNVPGTEFAPQVDNGDSKVSLLTEPLVQHVTDPTTALFMATAGLAAIFVLFGFRRLAASARQALVVFAIGAATSYLLASILLNLEKPNYYPLFNYLALMLIALAAGLIWQSGYRRSAAFTTMVLCLAGPFFAGFDERYEFDYYRHAAALAKAEEAPLVTSYRVRERAALLLRLEGWPEAEAKDEFTSHALSDTGRLAFQPGYTWLAREFVLGDEWVPQREWHPSDLAWQHRLLGALGQFAPLPSPVATLITPPPAVLLARDAAGGS